VPVLGLRALQDSASLERNVDRGSARSSPRASRVEWTVDFPKVSKRVRSMAPLTLVGDREHGVLIGAVLVTPRAGEIVGELVLALRIPLKTLADVTPISSLQPCTREKLARTRREGEQQSPHDPDVIHHNQWRSQ
jgi:hypothetical protein